MDTAISEVPTVFIIGDRFEGFSVHEGVYTVTQFTRALRSGEFPARQPAVSLRAGEGVTDFEWEFIRLQLNQLGLGRRVVMQDDLLMQETCDLGEVHKHREENSLLTDLYQVREGLFRADMRLHNDNELLLDHQTGQHVQGMVAIETARQMLLAVGERYYASRWPERKYSYIFDSIDTSFENFHFPLPATVEYEVHRADLDRPSRLVFEGEVRIEQSGCVTSRSRTVYTAADAKIIKLGESRFAKRVLEQAQRGDAPAAAPVPGLTAA